MVSGEHRLRLRCLGTTNSVRSAMRPDFWQHLKTPATSHRFPVPTVPPTPSHPAQPPTLFSRRHRPGRPHGAPPRAALPGAGAAGSDAVARRGRQGSRARAARKRGVAF